MQRKLLARIEAATQAVREAEEDLQEALGHLPVATRAHKAEATEAVRGASLQLHRARALLQRLQGSRQFTELAAAQTAILEAEKNLEQVLGQIVAVPGEDTTWASEIVRSAFDKLRVAKQAFAEFSTMESDADTGAGHASSADAEPAEVEPE